MVAQTPATNLKGKPAPGPALPTPVPDGFAERPVTLPTRETPVPRYRTPATAIAEGKVDQRIEVTRRHSEIGEVATALNRAFDERQHSEERLRQFVADASHEPCAGRHPRRAERHRPGTRHGP
ncbi:HAMP domain-containing protein [Streptomyces sioyaensis]|uniref:HAMP domain-containing protein n=1 Tax=Streptomyces sioyaensis TaxID=67364 RepID=UPI0033EDFB94